MEILMYNKEAKKEYYLINKEHILEQKKIDYQKNKEKKQKYTKEYNQKNKESLAIKHKEKYQKDKKAMYYHREQIIKTPWINSLANAKRRCNSPKNQDYARYGGRGIKCLITKEECAKLWERDRGWELKQHVLDRINNDGNYTLENCQFIENSVNCRKVKIDRDKLIESLRKEIIQLKGQLQCYQNYY